MNQQKPPLRHSRKISTVLVPSKETSLQSQLEAAQLQIVALKEQNANLNNKVRELERQVVVYMQQEQTIKLLNEELSFRIEQHQSMDSIIHNYEQINSQLTNKLYSMKQQLSDKQIHSTAQVTIIEGQSFENEEPSTNRFRQSQRGRSESVERKQNHVLTPKAQVKFSLNSYFDEEAPTRKRVFL